MEERAGGGTTQWGGERERERELFCGSYDVLRSQANLERSDHRSALQPVPFTRYSSPMGSFSRYPPLRKGNSFLNSLQEEVSVMAVRSYKSSPNPLFSSSPAHIDSSLSTGLPVPLL